MSVPLCEIICRFGGGGGKYCQVGARETGGRGNSILEMVTEDAYHSTTCGQGELVDKGVGSFPIALIQCGLQTDRH